MLSGNPDTLRTMIDVTASIEVDCGRVVLEKFSPDGDLDIVNAARVSLNDEHSEIDARDHGLIKSLMRNRHGTPFESPTMRWDIELPIAMCREFHRHRVGWSYNEVSARYTQLQPNFYHPPAHLIRRQVGKSMSYDYESITDAEIVRTANVALDRAYAVAWESYEQMLAAGVAKEVARLVLPVGIKTRMKAGCNLRSLMHFLSLRNHPAAQAEIRQIAAAMESLATEHVAPIAMWAFIEGGRIAP